MAGSEEVAEYTRTQQYLRRMLYRFDCPSPLTIGEYVLNVLDARARVETAQHVLECGLCEDELKTARTFMATEPEAPTPGVWPMPGVWPGLRRVVASLFNPGAEVFGYGMARGSEPSGSSEYRAGPVKIIVGSVPSASRGTASVDGLVLHDLAPAEHLADREVSLLDAARTQTQVTRTDDLGGFSFEQVTPGNYTLEVTLAAEIVVVEDLRISA